MYMSDFIESKLEAILEDWESVACRQGPGSVGMSREELRDLAKSILCALAQDMRIEQSEKTRHEKSLGESSADKPPDLAQTARGHAAERFAQGFTLNQLVAEYRALRASVVRRWRAEIDMVDEKELEDLTRFNEAIDESLTDAVNWYNGRVEDARILLNGVLAHDLRSPLGAILMSAEVLLHDDTLEDRQMRTAVRMRNSATRIKGMISDLLDFTRTRLGTDLPISLSDSDMGKVTQEVVEERRAFHSDADIRCKISGRLDGCWDGPRIEQMLGNLIGNAVEHGGNSPVTVIAKGHHEEIEVSVHNESGSIPEQEQRVIFDPLRRAAVRQQQDEPAAAGLGLGLYIARQIAEAHGGGIELDSSPDRGTTFSVQLPRKPKTAAATAGMT